MQKQRGRGIILTVQIQRSEKRRGCLLSYSQAEPGRELTQPNPRLLAEPCMARKRKVRLMPGFMQANFRPNLILNDGRGRRVNLKSRIRLCVRPSRSPPPSQTAGGQQPRRALRRKGTAAAASTCRSTSEDTTTRRSGGRAATRRDNILQAAAAAVTGYCILQGP